MVKRMRCDMLIQTIQNISWFNIFDDKLFECYHSNWFKSMPMWIATQREIDEYNISQSQSDQDIVESQQTPNGNQRKKKPRRWPREKQMLDNPNNPPDISNLLVVPICDFKCTHYTIDNYTLYSLLFGNKILDKKGKAHIPFQQFMQRKDEVWNKHFYMRKIKWFVRRKKEFDFRILSDGISVSLQYISPKLGLDPGLNKWCSAVQRNIETEKEVSSLYSFHKNSLLYV